MEKSVISHPIIKWQLILGAVVCAIVAFCALPGFVLTGEAAEPVTYIDVTLDDCIKKTIKPEEKTCTTYETLTKDICEYGLGKKDEETWYVLSEDINYNNYEKISIRGTVNLILEDGCTLKATKKDSMYIEDTAKLNVYGQSEGTGKLDLNGQTGNAGLRVGPSCYLNIKGGTIEAEGTTGGAGIGGDKNEAAGEINIYGGTVNAEGGKHGAGIGGGYQDDGGTVTIYGGTVNATGGYEAAGIGSGNEVWLKDDIKICGGKVFIYGGTVNATGQKYSAGIGGGDEGTVGEVTISGGDVTATGGDYGPGIGNGDATKTQFDDTTGTIKITGGKVTAKGGKQAAGIGSGDESGSCGTITIEGGYIDATGGKYGAAIGGGDQTTGGDIKISGGTIVLTNGESAPDIGGGNECEDEVVLNITGGSIKADDIRFGVGTPKNLHTITLEGVTDPVYVDLYCYNNIGKYFPYGSTDVQTMDGGKLYFYMTDADYEKLTRITATADYRIYNAYEKDANDPHTFKLADELELVGFTAQNEIYDGSPKKGYIRDINMSHDIKYWNMRYDDSIIYYLSTGEVTTPENSGAAREGAAPVYVGDYKVRINAFHDTDPIYQHNYPYWPGAYYGHCELDFKIEQATPTIVEKPTVSGVYGTAVKDMEISGGIVKVGYIKVEGNWTITDDKSTDIPDVGTTNSYEVTFTPDSNNYATVTTEVVPNVEKTTATIVKEPSLSGIYGTAVKDMEISGGVVKAGDIKVEGNWTVTDVKASDIPDVGTTNSYELKFNSQNCKNTLTAEVVPNVEQATPTIVEKPTLSGVYGTAVKDMEISGGVVKAGDIKVEGNWTITDDKSTDIPDVGTTNSYEVTFTPESNNYATVIATVVPNVEKVTPVIAEEPTLSGVYGTAVKDMEISGGVVNIGYIKVRGSWTITDEKATDIPDVGTTNSYEVTFTPESNNCATVIATVVPNVEKATPVVKNNPGFVMFYDKDDHTLREKHFLLVEGVSGDVVSPCDENVKIEGKWSLTEDELKRLAEDPTYRPDSVECVFIPDDQNNYNLSEIVNVEPEYYELDYIDYTAIDKSNQKLIEKVKEKLSDPEVKAKLSDSEVRKQIKEKLLSLIEE